MASALAWKNLSAGYGDTVVLENIDLALKAGEALSIIGRNGVGKTTLLATAMGQTTLRAGEVLLDSENIATLPIYRRALKGLGFVPQEREIFPSLSVLVETLAEVLGKLRDEGALTIVLVEQNSRVALAFSPRTVVMDRGRVVYDGPSQSLRDDPERLTKLIGVTE